MVVPCSLVWIGHEHGTLFFCLKKRMIRMTAFLTKRRICELDIFICKKYNLNKT